MTFLNPTLFFSCQKNSLFHLAQYKISYFKNGAIYEKYIKKFYCSIAFLNLNNFKGDFTKHIFISFYNFQMPE